MARITQHRRVLNSVAKINSRMAEHFSKALTLALADPTDLQLRIINKIHRCSDEEVANSVQKLIEGISMENIEIIEFPHGKLGPGCLAKDPRNNEIFVIHSLYQAAAPGPSGKNESLYDVTALSRLGGDINQVMLAERGGRMNLPATDRKYSSQLIPIKLIIGELKPKTFGIIDDRGRMLGTFKNVPSERPKLVGNYVMLNGKHFRVDGSPWFSKEQNEIMDRTNFVLHRPSKIDLLKERIHERRQMRDALTGHVLFQLINVIRNMQRQLSNTAQPTSILHADALTLLNVVMSGWESASNRDRKLYSHPFIIPDSGQLNRAGTMQLAIPYLYRPIRVVDASDTMPIPINMQIRLKNKVNIVFEFVRESDKIKLQLRGLFRVVTQGDRESYRPFPHYHWHANGEMCWGSCPRAFTPGNLTASTSRTAEAVAFRAYIMQLSDALETINANSPTESMPDGLPRLDTIVKAARDVGKMGRGWDNAVDDNTVRRETRRQRQGVNAANTVVEMEDNLLLNTAQNHNRQALRELLTQANERGPLYINAVDEIIYAPEEPHAPEEPYAPEEPLGATYRPGERVVVPPDQHRPIWRTDLIWRADIPPGGWTNDPRFFSTQHPSPLYTTGAGSAQPNEGGEPDTTSEDSNVENRGSNE